MVARVSFVSRRKRRNGAESSGRMTSFVTMPVMASVTDSVRERRRRNLMAMSPTSLALSRSLLVSDGLMPIVDKVVDICAMLLVICARSVGSPVGGVPGAKGAGAGAPAWAGAGSPSAY